MVLEDHSHRKRRLIPPVIVALGDNFSPFSWSEQIVPEIFWIALLIQELGPHEGVEVARKLGMAAAEVSQLAPKPFFASTSSFAELNLVERESLVARLSAETLQKLRRSMSVIAAIWPESPFAFLGLVSDLPTEDAVSEIGPLLERMYGRSNRESTIAIATLVYLGMCQDKIHISADILDKHEDKFEVIENYPNSEESLKAGAFFRAMAPMLLLSSAEQETDHLLAWRSSFWRGVAAIGGCVGKHQGIPPLPDKAEGFSGFLEVVRHFLHDDIRVRQQAWPLNLFEPLTQQVPLAILARQATLALEVISNPGIWNVNIAPILLRAMADAHITLSWLLGDLRSRVPMYVKDGLGAAKLELSHREEQMRESPDLASDEQRAYIDVLRRWLESQQVEFLTEVNLGSWSGKNTRVMAEEAGLRDFYNNVFQPFSPAVHSYWLHVGRLNVEYCLNPAHNYHVLPTINSFPSDGHWCGLAAKYFAKSLDAFDEFLGRDDIPNRTYAIVVDALDHFKFADSDQ